MKAKETHFELLERTRGDYLQKARESARELLKHRNYVTIDDVREVCPPPQDVDPRVMGAVFKQVDFESVGWVHSTRRECHKRPIQRFRLRQPFADALEREELPKRWSFFKRKHLAEDVA